MKVILCHPADNGATTTVPIDLPMDEAPEVLIIGTKFYKMGDNLLYYPCNAYSLDKNTFFNAEGTTFKI